MVTVNNPGDQRANYIKYYQEMIADLQAKRNKTTKELERAEAEEDHVGISLLNDRLCELNSSIERQEHEIARYHRDEAVAQAECAGDAADENLNNDATG